MSVAHVFAQVSGVTIDMTALETAMLNIADKVTGKQIVQLSPSIQTSAAPSPPPLTVHMASVSADGTVGASGDKNLHC